MAKAGQRKDLTGQRFGNLVALEYVGKDKNRHSIWKFQCDYKGCSNSTECLGTNVIQGYTSSCGCAEMIFEPGHTFHLTHGFSKDRLYSILKGMINRCTNPNITGYENYGGRGIQVCVGWSNGVEGYINFKAWALANGYKEHLTIERNDVNGDYCPENCSWITISQQGLNTRRTVWIEDPKTGLPIQARLYYSQYSTPAVSFDTFLNRIQRQSVPVEKAISVPPSCGGVLLRSKETII